VNLNDIVSATKALLPQLRVAPTRFRAYRLGCAGASFSYFDGSTFTLIEARVNDTNRASIANELKICGKRHINVLHITSWDRDHCNLSELREILDVWRPTRVEYPGYEPATNCGTACRDLIREYVRRATVRISAIAYTPSPARLLERLQHWNETLQSDVDEITRDAVYKLEESKRTGAPIPVEEPHPDAEMFPVNTRIEIEPGEEAGLLRVEATVGRSLWLWSLRRLLTRTLNVLHQHRWTILRSPPGVEWLTSDNPVVRLNYHDAQRYDFKGGWNSRGTVIFMPLSPTHLMFTQIGPEPRLQRGTVVSSDFAMQIQKITVEHAHRYVFGRSSDARAALWRPRKVDARAFQAEAEQWKSWNADQSRAEREIFRGWGT
jgi:hypothetical protein